MVDQPRNNIPLYIFSDSYNAAAELGRRLGRNWVYVDAPNRLAGIRPSATVLLWGQYWKNDRMYDYLRMMANGRQITLLEVSDSLQRRIAEEARNETN